jgi:transposase
MPDRQAIPAIVYVLRTGIQWHAPPHANWERVLQCMSASKNGNESAFQGPLASGTLHI